MFGVKPFKDLPARKREFIKLYVMSGDAEDSYAKAGYTSDARSIKARARNLVREVSPYLKDATQAYLQGTDMAIFGLAVCRKLAESAESEQVRLNAAKELLSRNLPSTPQEIHVHKTSDSLTDEQVKEKIRKLTNDLYLESKVVPINGRA